MFHHAFAEALIDRGFQKCRRDLLPMPVAVAEVENEVPIHLDILLEFPYRLEQVLSALGVFRHCC